MQLPSDLRLPLLIAAAVWLAALVPLADVALRRVGLLRRNYRGDLIPSGFGLVVMLWAAPVLLALLLLDSHGQRTVAAYLAAVAGFGGLGLLDDLFGTRHATGLRGHIRKLFVERELTTGLVKAGGGLAVGIVVARAILRQSWADALLDGVLIALSANTVNLLDLRPGRAVAFFLVGAVGLIASLGYTSAASEPLVVVLIPSILVYLRDRRGTIMVGDTGSNLLGATLGVGFVLGFPDPVPRLFLFACLLLIHIAAERYSLSAVIDRNAVLRWVDSLTGKR